MVCSAIYCNLLASNSWILALDLITWPLWAMTLRVPMATAYSTLDSVFISRYHLVSPFIYVLSMDSESWEYESILLMLEKVIEGQAWIKSSAFGLPLFEIFTSWKKTTPLLPIIVDAMLRRLVFINRFSLKLRH